MKLTDTSKLPIKKWEKETRLFQDDYTAAIGTDWLLNVAEAENRLLWEIIDKLKDLPVAAQRNEMLTPCDACVYNPPSSFDGKPCCMCPSQGRMVEREEDIQCE